MPKSQKFMQEKFKTQGVYVGLVLVVAVIVSALLIVFKPVAEKKPAKSKPPLVEYEIARNEAISIPVFSQGTVRASKQIKLVSEISGRIKSIAEQKFNGLFFARGELLVSIEDDEYRLAIARAEAQVAAAKQQLERVRVEAEQARFDLKQIGREASGSTDYALRKPHLAEAEANLKAANADYQIAKIQLQRTRISAPFDGRVIKKYVDAGQYVSVGSVLADLYSIEAAEIKLPLSLRQIELLGLSLRDSMQQGNEVDVELSSRFGDNMYTWSAKLSHTESELDARNRLLNAIVRVERPFDSVAANPDRPPLTPGMFVKATLTGLAKDNVIRLPRTALRDDGEVWVVNEQDKLVQKSVELYAKDKTHIFVKSGLKQGERVILNAIDYPVEGMALSTGAISDQPSNHTLKQYE